MNQFATTIGTPGSADRDELQRERFAATNNCEELELSDLEFARFTITHEPTGNRFKVYRGEIDAGPTHPASAYCHAENGEIIFLERWRR